MGPEWTALNLDPKTRGRKTDEGLEVIRLLWSQDKVDFDGVHYKLTGASIAPKPVQPDLPMWIGGSSEAAIRRTARLGTGWQAGPETPAQAREVVAAIKQAAAEAGRTIDDDHYGAGIPYRFGSPDDPALTPLFEAYRKRTGRDPKDYFAIGDADAIVAKIADYVEAGRVEIHPAPVGQGRRRDHGADPPPDRGGAAARRRPLAETGEAAGGGGVSRLYSGLISTLRNLITPSFLLAPVPSCSAITPLACVLSWTSTVLTPLSTTTRCGPCAVIS